MKVKQPAREVEVCDFCGREGFLQACTVCGKSFCLICEAVIGGCVVSTRVGKCCGKREDVANVVERYAQQFQPIVRRRAAALKKLPDVPRGKAKQ